MAIIEKDKSVSDERLYSEAFRKKLLSSPVLVQKQKEAKEIAKAFPKPAREWAK